MSDKKNFMSYGDAETVFSEYAEAIKTRAGTLVPSVSQYQTGTVTITVPQNSGNSVRVTFTTPMPDSNYTVVLTDVGSPLPQEIATRNLTATGFDISVLGRVAEGGGNIQVTWQAFKLMTQEDRALDEQAIADIQAVIPSNATSANLLTTQNDLDTKQDKTLETPLTIGGTSRTTVEAALSALGSETNTIGSSLTSVNSRVASSLSGKIIKINRSAIKGGAVILSDVFGSQYYISMGDQSDRFDCTRLSDGYISNTATFYVDGTSAYLEITSYSLYVVAVLGAAVVSGAETASGTPEAIRRLVVSTDLTSSVTSGSTAPITSGGVARVAGYIGQFNFDNGGSITISMDSTGFRRVTIYNASTMYSFVVHEWSNTAIYHWIVGTALPSSITATYSNYRLTLKNNSFGTARITIEAASSPIV